MPSQGNNVSTDLNTKILLASLTRDRLIEMGRALGVSVPASAKKERQVEGFQGTDGLDLQSLLGMLHRDELKAACKSFGLDASGRARPVLVQRLLDAAGVRATAPKAFFTEGDDPRDVPSRGDVVRVRHRQYLVEDVLAPSLPGTHSAKTIHRVSLVGLDDDTQGRSLEVLWELELGARVIHSERRGLAEPTALDPANRFGAYLATLRWNAVTATESRLFQAPFRAGIQLMRHQLVPLERALELPRANLFIADDVGLGKTIEAGLVLQELRLRQRVDFVLVVCPAAICLQWRDELWRRFGLRFEIVNRDFVARRRQERGFGVNPWTTHRRFIISHGVLRRPEYRDPLLHHLGERARKSLLVLDEAHVAAPASASRYAVDSRITTVIRDVAPRFENRLFLSATPHNGHSNSFSALLELLDPQRFTRGIRPAASQRDKVMVRRLKRDLRELGVERFPNRHVIRLELVHRDDGWHSKAHDSLASENPSPVRELGPAEPFELDLARLLSRYGELVRPRRRAGRVVLVRLQQRLLSSVEAFCRTLQAHAQHLARIEDESPVANLALPWSDQAPGDGVGDGNTASNGDETTATDDAHGLDDEELEELEVTQLARASQHLELTDPGARPLLDRMLTLANKHRDQPDAKARALLDWIRHHQCPGARWGGANRDTSADERRWSDRRLIVFTEFAHTLGYLRRLLESAFEGTERGGERLLIFRGGLGDAQREAIQRSFNGPPAEHPVRVLLATDAAREGVNLQGFCYDLFHYDIPWNPARIEQRNGRIDRTLQEQDDVYCHYFVYPQRPEDRVLDTLVRKVDVIHDEVGSLGTVILDQVEQLLAGGIVPSTAEQIERAGLAGPASAGSQPPGASRFDTVRDELEATRQRKSLARQIDSAGKILDRSRQVVGLRPALLRRVVDEALGLAGCPALRPTADDAFVLGEMPPSWAATVDTLRPPRERGEPLWEWRRRPPLPVVFEPPRRMRDDRVQLHLEHPLVKRLLSRFLAQGFGRDDLSRVTLVHDPESSRAHAVAFARLSLFGPGATRLHDELLSVAAPLPDGETPEDPLEEGAERRLVERLWRLFEDPPGEPLPEDVVHRLLGAASSTYATLWAHLRQEADSLAHRAQDRLEARGRREAADLRQLLEEQRQALERESQRQLSFEFTDAEKSQRRQWENDRRHMVERLERIDQEIIDEPPQLEALYQVALRRLEPVGLVYLWPMGS